MAKKVSKRYHSNVSTKAIKKLRGFNNVTKITAAILIVVLFAVFFVFRSNASTNWWKPNADKPLKLSWILGGRIDFNNSKDMGTVDSNGITIPGGADVFDLDMEYTTAEDVAKLHSMGKKVICYFDAGVYENYRADASSFPKSVIGAADEGWDGSYWLDIRQIDVLKPIMQKRMDLCKSKGFDAIEPDEITNWSNDNGFDSVSYNGHKGITYQDQIAYNKALATWAHDRGLGIGLKGDLEQAHDLVNDFDWSLNEECIQYSECLNITNAPDKSSSGLWGADGKDYPGLQLFTAQNKAVWIAEYKAIPSSGCTMAYNNRFNAAKYKLGLPKGGGFIPCPDFPPRNSNDTNVNPTATITSSVSSVTAPASFTLNAKGTDSDGTISKIEISLKGNVLTACNTANCTHNLIDYTAGTYVFTANVTDDKGGVGTASVTVEVKESTNPDDPNQAPTVAISTSDQTTLISPASFTLSADAKDSDGTVSQVQIFVNGQSGSIDKTSPYNFSFTNKLAGTYSIKAVATDNSGVKSAQSNEVIFTVNNNSGSGGSAPEGPSSIDVSSRLSRDNWWNGCGWRNNCKVKLSWQSATNYPTNYQVKRNGFLLGNTTSTTYEAPAYSDYKINYSVVAENSAGVSTNPPSVSVKVTCFLWSCWITTQ